MPIPPTTPESYKVNVTETREVHAVIDTTSIIAIVEKGELPILSYVRGAETAYLKTIGFANDCYIRDDGHWYQSRWHGESAYKIREATSGEIDVMKSFQDLRNSIFANKITG